MYDPSTASLIRLTPELPELDREGLPDTLSRAFAEIASARVALRDGDAEPESLRNTHSFARRLAHTNEALVAIAPDREDKAAAAFVAATAYQLIRQVDALARVNEDRAFVEADGISPDLSAMLLFLVAEASADATEIARKMKVPRGVPLQSELILALIMLAQGQVGRLTDRAPPSADGLIRAEGAERAVEALYFELLQGVRALAFRLQGRRKKGMHNPVSVFRNVQGLAAPLTTVKMGETKHGPIAVFPGPYQLAGLLIAIGDTLLEGALINIPPPTNVPGEPWRKAKRTIAASRPYLWRNHQDAIEKGCLEPGVSSVIGFPTGAGKSTVSQLKIQAVLLAGRTAVFLAPTHALVDQTARDLSKAFPRARVRGQREDEFGADGAEELPDIRVLTPEACLLLSHVDPEAFEDLGLVIFDECHLVHPKTDGSRRALDAMLCILALARVAPGADFVLLSAMMRNTDELTGWISELTARPALSLDHPWKPTRQLRGCIVYDLNAIKDLRAKLVAAHKEKPKGRASAAVARRMTAQPLGFFSVKQTWASQARADYALLPFYPDKLPLGLNERWGFTANAGVLAGSLAAAAAQAGVRTLVFAPTIPIAASIAERAAGLMGEVDVELTETENAALQTAIDELGGADQLYVDMRDGRLAAPATCHHGQLLPEERQVAESLYRRDGAVSVLAATSTLAQGMNLPAELVILSTDSEYNAETGGRSILKAEDLLNAAGRAGRAGENATGMVVVIPSKVTGINLGTNKIGHQWNKLRSIFSQSDQCLDLDDPLTEVMDRIHDRRDETGDLERYVVTRLVPEEGMEAEDERRSDLSRSFAAYRKRQAGDAEWVQTRLASARALLADTAEPGDDAGMLRKIAAKLGLPEGVLRDLRGALEGDGPGDDAELSDWCDWLFGWFAAHPDNMFRLIRQDTLEYLFGSAFKKLDDNAARAVFAVPLLRDALLAWMSGATFKEIQKLLPGRTQDKKRSTSARKFVIRVVPDLAHIFGSVADLLQRATDGDTPEVKPPPAAELLNISIRRGYLSAEMAAFAAYIQSGGSRLARREVHRRFDEIKNHLDGRPEDETIEQLSRRVEHAIEAEINGRMWQDFN
ncbi:DEAD/DEAH box helicase [Hyphococcus lacteus]|uniref:DEAD/DEAH box helicase n=1 Tax=Hyphococcus lacteus TaxID=3143536 RepID=A0ABV3Z6X5_9PROT